MARPSGASKFFSGAADKLRSAGKPLRAGLNGALLAGGLVAVGSYLAMQDRGEKYDPDLQPVPPLPPLLTPQELMARQQMGGMETGPVDGMSPDHFQRRVMADRGMSQEQQQNMLAAQQPRMSAVSPDSVQQLGANPTRPSV